jgi:hypothetical protein
MKYSIQIFVTLLIIAGISAPALAGETLQKTFEFGAGTSFTSSNFRTFPVPCHAGVEGVSITYIRKGDAGAANDVPIVLELHSPGTTAGELGPIVDSVNLMAKKAQQLSISTKLLKGDPSPRGCDLPWTVRVRSASGPSPWVVSGNITFVYFRTDAAVAVEGSLITLNKGNSVTKNVGGSGGLHAGRLTVSGTWLHSVLGAPGPLPVQLRFQLIDPSGTVVASKTAYSNAEVNPCCSGNKMSFSLNIDHHITGQWKLRITNNSSDDTMNIDPKIAYKATCP